MTGLREELALIYDQHKALSPKLVVDIARNPDHPLHHRFEWDDQLAGEQSRRSQAANMIRAVRIIYREDPQTGEEYRVRAYVSQPNQPNAYIPTAEAVTDPFTYQLVLRQFERSILALKRQYGHLQEYDAYLRVKGLGDAA